MRKLFSTQEVHPRDRFNYWHEVACKTIVDHDSRPSCRVNFQADLETGSVADIGLILFENSPMEIAHTRKHVANASHDDLFLCRQMAGVLFLEQCGREVTLRAGDMALLDSTLPYTGQFAPDSKLLLVKLPRRGLEARLGQVQRLTAIHMKGDQAEHGLTSSFLAMLPPYVGQIETMSQELLKEQTLDLIALSLAKPADGRARISSGQAHIILSLHAAVEARLGDPNLDVKTVAGAVGVSVRYANSLLWRENTSLVRLIQTKRLERCRKGLEDPRQAHRTISEIAFTWGFSDMTHFARIFKKTYGTVPSQFRRCSKKLISEH